MYLNFALVTIGKIFEETTATKFFEIHQKIKTMLLNDHLWNLLYCVEIYDDTTKDIIQMYIEN